MRASGGQVSRRPDRHAIPLVREVADANLVACESIALTNRKCMVSAMFALGKLR